MSFKQEKVIVIISEFVNDKREFYPITNVPVEKARFFYKDDDGLFKVMASSDYAVRTELNETRLYITNVEIKEKSTKFQVGYEINFTSSEYETSLPVLSVLVEMYNNLIEDSRTIFNYVKKQCFISDDKTTSLVLPNLPSYCVWCMGENGEMFALPVSELYSKFQKLVDTLYVEIKKFLTTDYNNYSKELRDKTDLLLKELTNLNLKLEASIKNLTIKKNEEIITTGNEKKQEIIDETNNQLNILAGVGLALKPKQVPDIEFLKRTNAKLNEVYEVLGYYKFNDGATHKRVIVDTDDGSGVQLNNKLWANIVHNGEVNVSWLGAKGDGITDDTQAIQKSINKYKNVYFPNKKYKITNTISILPEREITFEKGATIECVEDVDVIKIEGNYIRIRNLTLDVSKINFTHTALLFPETSYQESCEFYNLKLIGKDKCKNTNSIYDDFSQKTYENGIGIRFFKPEKYSFNIKFIDTMITGFTTAIQLYVPKVTSQTKPWITEVFFDNVSIINPGHAVEISDGWVQECQFKGYVQCHQNKDGMEYWSLYNGDRCLFDLRYWDTALPFYCVAPLSTAIINVNSSSRNICDDFAKTILLNNNKTLSDCYSSKGITTDNFSKILKKDGIYEIYPNNEKTYYLLLKDINGNYLHSLTKGGTKIIECDIETDVDTNIAFYVAPKYADYIENQGQVLFNTKYNILSISDNTVTLDKVDDLNIKDSICIPNTKSKAYGYITELGKFSQYENGNNMFTITNISGNTLTLSAAVPLDYINKTCFKRAMASYEVGNLQKVTSNIKKSCILKYKLPNFNTIIPPQYFMIGIYFLSNSNIGKIKINNIFIKDEENLTVNQLNNIYYLEKMKQENVYDDYITYMDEKTAYDNQQKEIEKQRQLTYQEALKENPKLTYEEFMSVQPMTLNLIEEPQPSKALKQFMEKYL